MSRSLVPGLALGLALLFPSSAFAVNIGVNGGPCAVYASIEVAVAGAASGDVLRIAPGVYPENTIALSGTDISLISADNTCAPGTSGVVQITPAGANRIFDLDASTLNLVRLDIVGGTIAGKGGAVFMDDSALILWESTVRDGITNDNGACIHAQDASTISMIGSRVHNCATPARGGGVNLDASTLKVDVDSRIHDNRAALDGGGVHGVNSEIDVVGTVDHNEATNGYGGGVFVANDMAGSGLVRVSGTVRNNRAVWGGGVHAKGTATTCLVEDGGRLHLNTASSTGGGISSVSANVDLLDGSQVDHNEAGSHGGGLYVSAGTLFVEGTSLGDARISDNRSGGNGGGAYLTAATLEARLADFDDNLASGDGGGLYFTSPLLPKTGTLHNVRMEGNEASSGGAILASGAVDLTMASDFTDCSTATLLTNRFCSELIENTATGGHGGAIRAQGGADLDLQSTGAARNTAATNGGLLSVDGGSTTASMENVLAVNNQTLANAAVRVLNGAHLDMEGNTLTGSHRAVAYAPGTSGSFDRNIAWGNTLDVLLNGIGGNCNTNQTAIAAPPGANNDQLDPMFNGANPRSTFKLTPAVGGAPGSPSIDACLLGPAIDLDGNARPIGIRFDRGAFEGP